MVNDIANKNSNMNGVFGGASTSPSSRRVPGISRSSSRNSTFHSQNAAHYIPGASLGIRHSRQNHGIQEQKKSSPQPPHCEPNFVAKNPPAQRSSSFRSHAHIASGDPGRSWPQRPPKKNKKKPGAGKTSVRVKSGT